MISDEYLKKLKILYFKKYNVKLNDEEAIQLAKGLLNLVKTHLDTGSKNAK